MGDYRVQFSYAGRDGDEYTVVGRQAGRELRPYMTLAGEELLILHPGIRGAGEVFQNEHNNNRTSTWLYRLIGWFVMFLGLSCLSTMLEMLLDLHPPIRRVLVLDFSSLQFSVSVTLTLMILGCGWLWYRPLVGLAVLGLAGLPYMVPVARIILERGHRQRQRQ